MHETLISKQNLQKIIRHSKRSSPWEACGILAGREWKIEHVFPVRNSLKSTSRFQMEPMHQLKVLMKIDKLGLDMIGFFHTHPKGPDVPSTTDCDANIYPRVISLIIAQECGVWKISAFLMEMHTFSKMELIVVER